MIYWEDDIVSSDCDDIIVNDVDDWSENDIDLELKAYARTPSVKIIPRYQENVLEIIELFLVNDLFELLVIETNRYCSLVINTYEECKSVKWVDVTMREMKKFLGLIILMGRTRTDSIYVYWSTLIYRNPNLSKNNESQ